MKNAPIVSKITDFVLLNAEDEDFSEKLKSCKDYDLFYHLSDFRRAVIQWYPFKKDARILEIHAELGALTGALCDCASEVVSVTDTEEEKNVISLRYRGRKNLSCIVQDELCSCEKKLFDYIVYIGGLEHFYKKSGEFDAVIQQLAKLKTYLKKDGTLLLAVENRYGIDNWLGKKDSFTGIPFDAVNNYMFGSKARSFTKTELETIIAMTGYKQYKFYYPIPDYRSARTIYTDDFLPENNDIERLDTAFSDISTFVADYRQTYDDIARAGCFPFFANSYLIEITDGDILASAQYITTSYKRGRKKSFSVIMNNDTVYKKCCFPEGFDYARHLCEEASVLRSREIPVVDMVLTDCGFIMPLVKTPVLQSYIRDLTEKGDCGRILSLLDKLWKYILQSSEYTENCAFDTGNINVGPILKKAFIELIPLNCFYANDNLLFFDQEFSKSNYPARYIMARCLRYIYYFIPKISSLISLESCYGRYGMDSAQWSLFWSVDDAFIQEADPYFFYTEWVNPDIIKKNQTILLHTNDIKTRAYDFTIMQKVYEIRSALKDRAVDFCSKHNLQVSAGTNALYMGQNDFDIFVRDAARELPAEFFLLQPQDTEPSGGHARLININTTAIEIKDWGKDCCAGIGIDIFVGMPEADLNNENQKRHFLHTRHDKVFRKAFYSANVPYQNYQKRFFNLFKDGYTDKNIVLFGDGIMFSRYFERYESEFVPSMLVHTSGDCSESYYNGIAVIELEAYQPEKIDDVYPVICTAYIRETERIIRRLGFRDYYFFVDDPKLICLEDPSTAYVDFVEDYE